MARIHFFHTVLRRNPTSGLIEPLGSFEAEAFPVDASGVESGTPAAVFASRTGSTAPASMSSDANGTIQFYLNAGDYNVHISDSTTPARLAPFVLGVGGASGAVGGIPLSQLASLIGIGELDADLVNKIGTINDTFDAQAGSGGEIPLSNTGSFEFIRQGVPGSAAAFYGTVTAGAEDETWAVEGGFVC
jgi:hypothetical protein